MKQAMLIGEREFEVVSDVSGLNEALGLQHQPVVFECTGRPEVAASVMDLVPAPAEVVLVGTFEKSQTMELNSLARYETRIVGSQMYTMEDMAGAVETLAGPDGQTYEQLISDEVFPLEHVREAYEEALDPADGVKVQIGVDR